MLYSLETTLKNVLMKHAYLTNFINLNCLVSIFQPKQGFFVIIREI